MTTSVQQKGPKDQPPISRGDSPKYHRSGWINLECSHNPAGWWSLVSGPCPGGLFATSCEKIGDPLEKQSYGKKRPPWSLAEVQNQERSQKFGAREFEKRSLIFSEPGEQQAKPPHFMLFSDSPKKQPVVIHFRSGWPQKSPNCVIYHQNARPSKIRVNSFFVRKGPVSTTPAVPCSVHLSTTPESPPPESVTRTQRSTASVPGRSKPKNMRPPPEIHV